MEGWLILQLPGVLLLFLAAVFCCLFDRFAKTAGGFMTILGAVLAITAAALLLLYGGSLWETAVLLTVYLLLNAEVKHEL